MMRAWHCQTCSYWLPADRPTWSSNGDKGRRMVDAGVQAQPVVALLVGISADLDRSCAVQSDAQVGERCDTSLGGRSAVQVARVQRLATRTRIVFVNRTVCLRVPGAGCLANPQPPWAAFTAHNFAVPLPAWSCHARKANPRVCRVRTAARRVACDREPGTVHSRAADRNVLSQRSGQIAAVAREDLDRAVGDLIGPGIAPQRSGGQSVETASSGGPFRNR